MKKMIALCMAAVMSLALLAGCLPPTPTTPMARSPQKATPVPPPRRPLLC